MFLDCVSFRFSMKSQREERQHSQALNEHKQS